MLRSTAPDRLTHLSQQRNSSISSSAVLVMSQLKMLWTTRTAPTPCSGRPPLRVHTTSHFLLLPTFPPREYSPESSLGRYRLDISERESEIVVSNSPFFPLVSPNVFDPAYSTATGMFFCLVCGPRRNGSRNLPFAPSGDLEDLSACDSTSALVVITARDRYGNPTGLAGLVFNARFSGPEASVVR